MKSYDFTLAFRLKAHDVSPEMYVDALYSCGCDDALIGVGSLGNISLNFTRDASSAVEAVSTAINDVHQAIPDARLVEATPDYVGMTEIAEVYDVSRQYVRKMVASKASDFPSPVHEGRPSLWRLADVIDWIVTNEKREISAELYEISKLNRQINIYRESVKALDSRNAAFRIDVNPLIWGNKGVGALMAAIASPVQPRS